MERLLFVVLVGIVSQSSFAAIDFREISGKKATLTECKMGGETVEVTPVYGQNLANLPSEVTQLNGQVVVCPMKLSVKTKYSPFVTDSTDKVVIGNLTFIQQFYNARHVCFYNGVSMSAPDVLYCVTESK